MAKITIGVYKSYRNSGYRNHRQKTKKHWCHYFIEYDEYGPTDEDSQQFGTEWVNPIRAMMLKRKVWKKKRFHCMECDTIWRAYVPAKQNETECPRCDH